MVVTEFHRFVELECPESSDGIMRMRTLRAEVCSGRGETFRTEPLGNGGLLVSGECCVMLLDTAQRRAEFVWYLGELLERCDGTRNPAVPPLSLHAYEREVVVRRIAD